MKPRQLAIIIAQASGVPLAIGLTQLLAMAIPVTAATLVGAALCGFAGFSLVHSIRKLIP